jgi:diguanylate cyclase (GGDEF)-like protein
MSGLARAKVLCVDDEPQVLEGLRLQLGRRYEVLTALNGPEALEILTREPSIAAIVSDMRMPLMNGAAFLARARTVRPHAGRILLTGQTDLQSAIAAVNEAGILKFLSKPCPPPKLQAAIEAAIHHHRRSRSDTTTMRRALSEELASEDLVTGLASRKRFTEVLTELCAVRAQQPDAESYVVMMLQLENLRETNALQGHSVGDQLLYVFAQRLRERCPDASCLARWGDQQFAVLLALEYIDEAALLASAEALIAQLAIPVALPEGPVRLRACIGIAAVPLHTAEAGSVIKFADIAVRQARLQGGGTARLFRRDWAQGVEQRYQLLVALREAIEANALELNFHPIIDYQRSSIRTFEALVRWRHPALGMVPPAEFISLAEESGEMPRLGQWIFHRACLEGRMLAGRYCARVAVNISMHQLLHDGFLDMVDEALQAAQLHPQELEIELTETVFSRDTERTLAVVGALRKRGITVAIDDFGTGYSSLAYLQRFPADAIKVDRSFVSTLGQGGETIISAALSIGRSFGMEVVIEGVETELQRRQLLALGASLFQGFLYGQPIPLREVESWFLSSAFSAEPSEVPSES